LKDSKLLTCHAKGIAIKEDIFKEKKVQIVTLDQTIVHPQGEDNQRIKELSEE
jgi:hypothetical protein